MNQDLTTKAGVAEILEESGIDFKTGLAWFEDRPMNSQGMLYSYTGPGKMPAGRSARPKSESGDKQFARSMEGYKGPWLTSNQSEAILEKRGVQVIKRRHLWFLADNKGDLIIRPNKELGYPSPVSLPLILMTENSPTQQQWLGFALMSRRS